MKILLVNDYGSPLGGAEVLTFALRDALRRQGHDVRLFSSSAGTSAESRQAEYACYGTLSRFRTVLQTLNPWAYLRLRRVLREFKPDVVHVRMFLTQLSPLILPLLRRVPSLYHVVWYRPICLTGTKLLPTGSRCHVPAGFVCYRNGCVPLRDWAPLRFQLWLWRKWRHAFTRIVANSYAVQASLMAEGIEPVEVIHNGVIVEPIARVLASKPVAVFAGRLVAEKGVDVLLRAFAIVTRSLPEARLIIAGDGPKRTELLDLTEELEITARVTFLGHVAKREMDETFAQAWVQVVPSRWAEPFGLVAVEAMMRKTAVIASATGGLCEIVEDGATGFLVPPNDPGKLAEKLTDVLGDRAKAEAMGKSGRKRAETRFSLARQCEQFTALYRQMASRTAPAKTMQASSASRPDKPVVSVIVEGYNESRDLGKAVNTLEALERQDFPADQVEVILLGSAAQVKEWNALNGQNTPFWRLHAVEADGLSYLQLKNHGAQFASAGILAFTDSDVYPHRAWLSSLVEGIRSGGDVSIGLSLFKSSTNWEWNRATRLAAASITWGWIVGKTLDPERNIPRPVGFMDHNFGLRVETFRRHQYNTRFGRLCGAPLLARSFLDGGVKLVLRPHQRVTHYFSWRYWLIGLHFRYGYEVFMLRRLNDRYPNQWIARTKIFEPVMTMAWHVLLDIPRWFRVSRLLDVHPVRRVLLLPLVIVLSCAARAMEMAGMYWTMAAPEAMRKWAESV